MKVNVRVLISILAGLFLTSTAWGQVEVPEKIKKVAPIYKGANILQSFRAQDGAQVIFEVKASPKEVIIFYKDAMQKKG